LKVPSVTLRENTERPETIEVGSNQLAGLDPERAVRCARRMLRRQRGWANPFGDGRTGARVVRVMEGEMQERC